MIESILKYASSEVQTALRDASNKTGVSFDFLLSKAYKESSFRKDVQASTSSASGLFQFIKSTWMSMVKTYGHECGLGKHKAALQQGKCSPELQHQILALRNDPKLSSFMAAKLTQENTSILKQKIGREPTNKELYLAHFMGPSSAGKFINHLQKTPSSIPCSDFKQCALANQGVFKNASGGDRSYKEVFERLTSGFVSEKQAPKQVAQLVPQKNYNAGSLVPNSLSNQNLSSWMMLDLLQFQAEDGLSLFSL